MIPVAQREIGTVNPMNNIPPGREQTTFSWRCVLEDLRQFDLT